jgi:hypothetical protein
MQTFFATTRSAHCDCGLPRLLYLTELSIIRYEPDNCVQECALEQPWISSSDRHGSMALPSEPVSTVSVMKAGEFLNLTKVGRLVKKLLRNGLRCRSGDHSAEVLPRQPTAASVGDRLGRVKDLLDGSPLFPR